MAWISIQVKAFGKKLNRMPEKMFEEFGMWLVSDYFL